MTRAAWAVVDLGFGDSGKGALTDALVRARGATLVVRHHGGAQAGHNVVTPDGRHHTFAQFAAGTLAGAEGLLGRAFLLHPGAMAVEAKHLAPLLGGDPFARTWIDARARVITPFQQAAGRLRERARGARAHGTCGVGVGECVDDDLRVPEETIRADDLGDRARLVRRLERQRERKRAELVDAGVEGLEVFDDDGLVGRAADLWTALSTRLRLLTPDQVDARLAVAPAIVFEGAQGVLLDERWGFHPHTTWSDCAGLVALPDRPVRRIGVTRSYLTRHGPGPFPTAGIGPPVAEPHNGDDGWQGPFRTGALDLVLLRYALEVAGPFDALAVSHLDRRSVGPIAVAYRDGDVRVTHLELGSKDDLGHRERLGRRLETVVPEVVSRDVRAAIEALGVPIGFEGWGADASRWRIGEGSW